MTFSRRQFLSFSLSGAALLGLRRPALAIGSAQKINVLALSPSGKPLELPPGSIDTLLEETRIRTSIDTASHFIASSPLSSDLENSLFAIVSGTGPFSFSGEERQHLSRWLGLGGLLLFDNSGSNGLDRSFDESARREIKRLLPDRPLERISSEHVLYRTYYRLDYPAGRSIHKPYLEGANIGHRYAVILNSNDLLGALAQQGGRFLKTPSPGGERQREMAMRFGVNLMMYASCLHYKDDQAHLNFLLHRRNWKIVPPP